MTTASACFSSLHFQLSRLRAGLPLLAAASLLAMLPVLPGAAWAQISGQYGATIDPPGRVARLNLVEGAVSFAPADAAGAPEANAWTPALLNRPLTSGDRLWTGPRARSELHIGSTALRMSEQTSLDFLTLDDDVVQLRLAQGSIRLRVRTLFEGQRLEVNTPNLAFVITQPGDYRLDADPASNTTRVVALSGAGVIYGDGGETVNLGSQQQANFSGTQLTPAGPGAAVQDSFDAWAADRDRREDQSVSARYVPRETLGYQQLDSYGDWRQDATYGAVWLPRAVPVHWAPYRMGHWSWIAPWGWTWIDDAPWGFAPFHYGRWAQIGPRWAWVPGRLAPRPVYAPALVAFVGGNSGGVHWNISIGSGGAPRPGLGWFPLAPDEPFRPAYRVSPRYVSRVNHNIVVNNTVNRPHSYRYQHQPAAVTAVSRDDFSRGRPVRGNLAPLSPADLSRAQVVTGGLAEGAANRGALPPRPDFRERPRPAAAAALPPAAVMAAQPVVRSRDERRGDDRRDERRDGVRNDRGDDRRDARKDERPDDRGAAPRAQTPVLPVLPSPLPAAALPGAQFPAARPGPATPFPAANPQDRNAIDAENRARREQQQLQRDQERQQGALARQQDAQRRQAEESLGQRALREQAQKNANLPPPTSARQADQDARAAAERSAAEQAQRAQQQLQRDQQRQQADLNRQQEQQRRLNDELASQRAVREQAQRQQAQQQLEQQREHAARQMQEQQRQQQALQQQQRAQQDQQRRNEELLGQRALREQAQRQQEQQRQQQVLQQQQQRALQDQQRQAHEQSQRQQQEQRKQQAEGKPQAPQADAPRSRVLRPEGGPNRNREQ